MRMSKLQYSFLGGLSILFVFVCQTKLIKALEYMNELWVRVSHVRVSK